LIAQNPELKLKKGDIKAKFSCETKKRVRNLVTEVGAQNRKRLLKKKVKLGWFICKTEDYVFANKCFNSPGLTTGFAKLKECTATPMEYKCINCLI
jgi:hypothetical protein